MGTYLGGIAFFFSHGGDDRYIVEELLKPKIEASGAVVFVDTENISYGDRYREIIVEELVRCDELLVLITPSSLRRPWVFLTLRLRQGGL